MSFRIPRNMDFETVETMETTETLGAELFKPAQHHSQYTTQGLRGTVLEQLG